MRPLVLLIATLVGVGCSSSPSPSSSYVTHEQLKSLLALPDHEADPTPTAAQRRDVDALVLASFTPPEQPKAEGAAPLAVADRRLQPLANAVGQIDRAVEVCAHNLANVETTAFKATCAASNPDGTVLFRTNMEQGSLQNTGRQLDLGISGQGFFKVRIRDSIGDGFAYTRNGNFFVNADGDLVLGMGDGYKLEPKIVVPKGVTDISISQDGQVDVVQAGMTRKRRIGQITLHQFVSPEGLNLLGGSIFTPSEVSGPPRESRPGDEAAGQVLQGFLEGSNVDATRERLRIRFLQNWRNTILKSIEDAK